MNDFFRSLISTKLAKWLPLIFITLLAVWLMQPNALQSKPSDAIAVRIVANPSHQSALSWYNQNAALKGSPQALLVDGYEAVRDGRTVYVNAANVDLGQEKLFTNIYIISYNQGAESSSEDIFGQILENWHFNVNLDVVSGHCSENASLACLSDNDCAGASYCLNFKSKVTRDTIRLARLGELREVLDAYGQAKGHYPILASGTYLPNKTISVWPSWQATLGKELGAILPKDPVNRLAACPGFDQSTCWNQADQTFAWSAELNAGTIPPDNFSFLYSTDSKGSAMKLCTFSETGFIDSVSACNSVCIPFCFGKECGDNGCGGFCGACGAAESCVNDSCVGLCTTGPGCRNSLANATAVPGYCADPGQTCFGCKFGFDWNGSACVSACVPDGCNGICPFSCSAGDDPDCGAGSCGDGCCSLTAGETNVACSADCPPTCIDADSDGYGAVGSSGCSKSGVDCNDTSVFVNPGESETCDNHDNDCDGAVDDGCDDDNDDYCDKTLKVYNAPVTACNKTILSNGASGNDCDDVAAAINPGAAEVCGNNVDENCDGTVQACSVNLSISIAAPTLLKYRQDDSIFFKASVIGGGIPYFYEWSSNLDGKIGASEMFSINTLSVGNHVITLKVTDANGTTLSATVNIEISSKAALTSAILTPAANQTFPQGSSVSFATFASGGSGPYTYNWSSSIDGSLSVAANFSTSSLSQGSHVITLTTRDSAGAVFVDSIKINIVQGLVVTVFPLDNSSYFQGNNVVFQAVVAGGSGNYNYEWRSDLDGVFSSATVVVKKDLTVGIHNITIKVADTTSGEVVSKTIKIEVKAKVCVDGDGDGFGASGSAGCLKAGIDCNDADAAINPGAIEVCANAIDENCNASITDCPVSASVIVPAADGQNFERGTSMLIKVSAPGATWVSADVQYPDNSNISLIILHDDGTHGDTVAGDGVWTNLWTVKSDNNGTHYIDLWISSTPPINNARNFNVVDSPSCIQVINNGPSGSKLDILFIADKFTAASLPTFVAAVNNSYDKLITVPPFDTQKTKLNISRIDVTEDLGCQGYPNYTSCNISRISEIASACKYDQLMAYVNVSGRSYASSPVVLMKASPATFLHEFGHSFGKLADEYVDSGIPDPGAAYVNASVNCETSSLCPKWSAVTGSSCIAGCAYRNTYYRSINTSIMKSPSAASFGVVNINQLIKKLNPFSL